jgi:hypothetical protein
MGVGALDSPRQVESESTLRRDPGIKYWGRGGKGGGCIARTQPRALTPSQKASSKPAVSNPAVPITTAGRGRGVGSTSVTPYVTFGGGLLAGGGGGGLLAGVGGAEGRQRGRIGGLLRLVSGVGLSCTATHSNHSKRMVLRSYPPSFSSNR